MRVANIWPLLFVVPVSVLWAEDKPKGKPGQLPSIAEELRSIIREGQAAQQEFLKALRGANTEEEREKALAKQPRVHKCVKQLLQFAEKHPKQPQALDALAWVVIQDGIGIDAHKLQRKAIEVLLQDYIPKDKRDTPHVPLAELILQFAEKHHKEPQALDAIAWIARNGDIGPEEEVKAKTYTLLLKDHIQSDKLGDLCEILAFRESATTEKVLRSILDKSPHHDVQGLACFGLARQFKNRSQNTDRVNQAEADRLSKEAVLFYERVIEKYGDVRRLRTTLGCTARPELFELRHLAIGTTAPDIEGEDIDGKKFKLSEDRGKVIALVFWGNWCAPCRAMYPQERALVKQWENKPFVLVAVNSDKDKDELKKVLKKEQITWRFWWDGGGASGPIASKWNVHSWPMTYVLDHKGVIRFKNVRGPEMEKAVEGLLKEKEESEKQP